MNPTTEQQLDYDKRWLNAVIASQLIGMRLRLGVSVAELSEHSGVPVDIIDGIENHDSAPTLDTLVQLTSAMGQQLSLTIQDK